MAMATTEKDAHRTTNLWLLDDGGKWKPKNKPHKWAQHKSFLEKNDKTNFHLEENPRAKLNTNENHDLSDHQLRKDNIKLNLLDNYTPFHAQHYQLIYRWGQHPQLITSRERLLFALLFNHSVKQTNQATEKHFMKSMWLISFETSSIRAERTIQSFGERFLEWKLPKIQSKVYFSADRVSWRIFRNFCFHFCFIFLGESRNDNFWFKYFCILYLKHSNLA